MSTSAVLPAYHPSGDVVADKAAWRALVRRARAALVDGWSAGDRDAVSATLACAGLAHLRGQAVARGGGPAGCTVLAFEPRRTEPPVDELTRVLRAAGVRVLVPITLARPSLDWADLADPDRTPLGQQVLTRVDLAFVPALAVSVAGVRLGQGGGYYDTVLPRLRAVTGAEVVAVLHDHELVPRVPAERHDALVDAVLRPTTGVRPLPS